MKSCMDGQKVVKDNIVKIIKEKDINYCKKYPSARWKHAAVVYQNFLYIMGGCSWIAVLKDLWRLDLKTFTETMQDNVAIHEFWNTFDYYNENLWYDLSGFIGHIPPLQSHTMIAYNNKLYIFGGTFVYDIRDCPLWIYSLEYQIMRKWKVKDNSAIPAPRRNHSCLIYRDTILIFGGFGDVKGSIGDLWVFDLKSEMWILIWCYQKNSKIYNDGPCPRHDHISVIYNKSMFIYGGMNGLSECTDLWQWNIDEGQWTKIHFKMGPVTLRYINSIKIHQYWIIYGISESKGKPEKWKYSFRMNKWFLDYSNLFNLPLHSTFSLSSTVESKILTINKWENFNSGKNKIHPMSEYSNEYKRSSDKLCMKSCSTINTLSTFEAVTPLDVICHTYAYNNLDFQDQLETTFSEIIDESILVGKSKVDEYIFLLGNNIDKAYFDNYICIQFSLL